MPPYRTIPSNEEPGFPRFKKPSRSVEYKLTGYQLSDERRKIKFIEKHYQ